MGYGELHLHFGRPLIATVAALSPIVSPVQSTITSVTREEVALSQQSYWLDNILTTNHRDVSFRYRLVPTNCSLTDVTDVARIMGTEWHSSERALRPGCLPGLRFAARTQMALNCACDRDSLAAR
jgi:hypothetical protein